MTARQKFSVRFPVRFGDIDHAGIVYYPRFFHYVSLAGNSSGHSREVFSFQ